jgi:hypothetical protein
LQLELHRLYAVHGADAAAATPGGVRLVDDEGRVRALVLELGRPADWTSLSKVWQGVQLELKLPAAAIAVTGTDAYQLWFSLAQAVPVEQALAFLQTLRQRFLAEAKADRLRLWPNFDAASPSQGTHAAAVPALQADGKLWSAFVAPDLAPVFEEEPWLDMPPNPVGQADLLAPLRSVQPDDFQRVLLGFGTTGSPAEAGAASRAASDIGAAPGAYAAVVAQAAAGPQGQRRQARAFLLEVMNDDTVALALRIEAAKALLPFFEGSDAS